MGTDIITIFIFIFISISITTAAAAAAAAAARPGTSGFDREGATRQKWASRTGCTHDDHT